MIDPSEPQQISTHLANPGASNQQNTEIVTQQSTLQINQNSIHFENEGHVEQVRNSKTINSLLMFFLKSYACQ